VFRSGRKLWARWIDWRYGRIDRCAPIGLRGEHAAARLLRRKGYLVIAQGERDAAGEIDLIALHRPWFKPATIVFVEVKTLATTRPGHPAERVDADKQRRLTNASLRYLKRHKLLEHRARFDVIAVWWTDQERAEPNRIEHFVNAFEAVGEGQFYS
jgi:putative endonuclease